MREGEGGREGHTCMSPLSDTSSSANTNSRSLTSLSLIYCILLVYRSGSSLSKYCTTHTHTHIHKQRERERERANIHYRVKDGRERRYIYTPVQYMAMYIHLSQLTFLNCLR